MIMKILAVIVMVFLIPSIASCSQLEVFDSTSISGLGTIDIDRSLQSSKCTSGLKLSESVLPIYTRHRDLTNSYYSSELEFIMDSNVSNSSIFFEQAVALPNSKHHLMNENFLLGVCTAYYYKGSHLLNASFESSSYLSEAIVHSEAEGRTVLSSRIMNLSDYHVRNLNSRVWLEGRYQTDWNFLVIKPENPEAGEEDYMACP